MLCGFGYLAERAKLYGVIGYYPDEDRFKPMLMECLTGSTQPGAGSDLVSARHQGGWAHEANSRHLSSVALV